MRDRIQEDELISNKTLELINQFLEGNSINKQVPGGNVDLIEGDELELVESYSTLEEMQKRLGKGLDSMIFLPDGRVLHGLKLDGYALLSGSFNPVHEGHVKFAEQAAKAVSIDPSRVIYEISLKNVDKGVKDVKEIVETRVKALQKLGLTCMLTTKGMFAEKNELVTNGFFLLGADTLVRLVDKKYYDGSREKMAIALDKFCQANNRVVVAPRVDSKTGKLVRMADVDLPEALQGRVEELSDFRIDLSSTELRKNAEIEN